MAGNFMKMARKLQGAIKQRFNINLLINTNQWFHNEKNMAINVYTVKQSFFDADKQKNTTTELFSTYSQIQLVLFMRDLWYELNGWEIPTDNPVWEKVKSDYQKTKLPNNIDPVKNMENLDD